MNYSVFFDEQIRIQQKNLRVSICMSALILLTGIIATVFCFRLDNNVSTKMPEFMKLGPLFISFAVTSFPLKTFSTSRVRIAAYRFLRNCCDDDGKSQDQTVLQAVLEALKQTVKVE